MSWRNIYYNPRKKSIHLWWWDEKGRRKTTVESFMPYCYVESNNHNDAISIFNTPLKKLEFPNSFDRRRYVKDSGMKRFFYNIRPEQQYLLDKFKDEDVESAIQNPLRIFFLDIETYSKHNFPVPQQANHTVNLITIYDSLQKQYITFGLQHPYTPQLKNSFYIQCQTETELLQKFLEYWTNNYPDVVSGWASEYFDIPYIINRITKILDENEAKRLSPVGSLYYREDIKKQFGKDLGRWHIHGTSCIDYMEAYKSFSREMRESYSLNYISQIELGEGKTTYNATNLARLADQDWTKFCEYNIQDVTLLTKLENKLRFIQLMRMISYKGFSPLESSMGKVSVITGAIAKQALKQNKIIPTFATDDMGNYTGGYVKEISPGLREGIITFDANSLYPNTLLTLNLSLETKVGKVINYDKEQNIVEVRLVNGKCHTLTTTKFQEFLKKKNLSISSAKVLYSQTNKGVIPEYVDGLYTERVKIQEEQNAIAQANHSLNKRTKEYKNNKQKQDQLDIQQYTLKILLNSIYGVFANRGSPFYDIDHAASITNTGQNVVKTANKFAEKYIRAEYGTTEESYVYSDTDSIHISLKPLLDSIGEELLIDNELNPIVYDKANEIQKVINEKIKLWAKNTLFSNDPRFFFKREAICAVGVYQSKKHYILHVRDQGKDKPLPCDHIKYVGVEVAKSTFSNEVKELIKRVVEAMLHSKNAKDTNKVYKEVYEEFKQLPLEQISFRTNVNNYTKYASKAQGFRPAKRTPVHVKASLFYNLLLKEFNIETNYEVIGSAQKIKWFYTISTNRYNIECIGFIDNFPDELKDIIKPDFQKMFSKIIQPAIQRMYECTNWRLIDVSKEYQCDLFELLGEDE